MGKFIYDEDIKVDFDDRVLAHLQAVMVAKLRRQESFLLSWKDNATIGDGRSTVWLHPRASIVFKYYGSRTPALNRTWIDQLMYNANQPHGLYVTPEPPDEHAAVHEA
ncbi:hypothetical protein QL996_02940 [Planococcus sp. APC 4015]|nr:hypothetical protein [Planococcus sp. APC 4015]